MNRTPALFCISALAGALLFLTGPATAASPNLPGGLSAATLLGGGIPTGLDVEGLIRQYQEGQGALPQGVVPTAPPQVVGDENLPGKLVPEGPTPEERLRDTAENLLWNGQIDDAKRSRLEFRGESLGLRAADTRQIVSDVLEQQATLVAAVTVDVELLRTDGEITPEDLAFLQTRTRDRGLSAKDADKLLTYVQDRVRRRETYRTLVDAFLEDAAIDPTENALLQRRVASLGLTDDEREEILDTARKNRRRMARDILGQMQQRDEGLSPVDEDLALYGQKFFHAPLDAFAPATEMAPPESYRVGPGDVFQVNLWGAMEEEFTLVVDAEGRLHFPKIGAVGVGGMTYGEARGALVAKAESITGVSASVLLAAIRPVQVLVVGEVKSPGALTLRPFSNVVHALMAAEGPSDVGSLRHVMVRRGGQKLAEIDLYQFLHEGTVDEGRVLQTGDVVVVPKARRLVELSGEVRKPAVYELLDGEGLRDLLGYAGGLTSEAFGGRVQIARPVRHEQRTVIDISLSDLDGDFPLRDGDQVQVFALSPEVANEVSLYGHVYHTGSYAWVEGMRVTALLGAPSALKPEVDLTYAVIVRKTGADRATSVHPFRPEDALADPGGPADPLLQPFDEVYIFPRDQFQAPLRAKATGELRTQGWQRFVPGARIAELLRLAGGPTPEALLDRAELIRTDPDGTRITVYVDLAKVMAGDPQENLALRDRDELRVLPLTTEHPDEFVLVAGEVQNALSAEITGETVPEQFDRVTLGNESPQAARGTIRIPLTKGMRIHDLVFKAGGLTKDAYRPVAQLYRTNPTTREVTILTFDLGRALDLDPDEDLLLTDRDHVVIHAAKEFHPLQPVVVAGMVTAPGQYPYASNMRVRDLVLAAGGLKEEAYLTEAEIVRTEIVDNGEEARTRTIRVDLAQALAGNTDENLSLQPYDKVFVKRIPEWRETWSIELRGEVRFPGLYYVAKGEKLSSVIWRAGGYTEEAYLRGAIFSRESAKARQQQRLNELRKRLQQTLLRATSAEVMSSINPGDVAAMKQYMSSQQELLSKLQQTRATGRIVVKVLPLEELEGSDWDMALEDGDTLQIPKTPQTVDVVGSVYNPTSLLWEPDNPKAEHYLYKTGGPTKDAEENEIYIVRADGTVVSGRSLAGGSWWSRGVEGMELFPGDTVLVPEKVIRAPYMRMVRDFTQILYQIAITAGVALTLF